MDLVKHYCFIPDMTAVSTDFFAFLVGFVIDLQVDLDLFQVTTELIRVVLLKVGRSVTALWLLKIKHMDSIFYVRYLSLAS